MALSACNHAPVQPEGPLYSARDYVGDGVFTDGIEGPAVGPDGALYVVNMGGNGTIGRVATDAAGNGQAQLFARLPAGRIGNGIRFAEDGLMYVADYAGHAILRVDPANASVSTFVALPDAHQPNDIARAPNGDWYASDPDWANDSGQVWHIGKNGLAELLVGDMGTTNGIEVSPDGKHLYVNESVQRRIWDFSLGHDGRIVSRRLLIQFADHGLDGMRSDVKGNLYVARYGAGTVAILSPDGSLLRQVELKGRKPTNVAFGGADGRDVYVTMQDRGAIEMFRSDTPGREAGLP
ncbi:gluconolactonase [Pseudoxanthomonas dokdonensis]|uniref:Gluconolactonase n=2 Tax=Pseudoxanthomonas dokdonensis TaxID=344882 RepID=A0A0R0CZP8_9GAMM|nr:SMP-30/gluconolactonase/LRE family protein [Pseudoxanthomonas dokdonensis]KRG71252.1 gluconolactonase [Pseudoxanthomonas dokdonensis]